MTYKELATFLKVLSDSSRLEILDLLLVESYALVIC